VVIYDRFQTLRFCFFLKTLREQLHQLQCDLSPPLRPLDYLLLCRVNSNAIFILGSKVSVNLMAGVSVQLRNVHRWAGSPVNITRLSPRNSRYLRRLRVSVQPFSAVFYMFFGSKQENID